MFFMLIRLAVRFATHPLSNSIRALAMSGVSLTTATPLADIFRDVRFDNAQDDIDIVDHQVEDHRHIGAPGVKLGQAVAFDEHRLVEVRLCSKECRVKPLHMTHLDLYIGLPCYLDQFPCLLQ